ncbi:MAG: hypothetical protein ACTHK2_03855 [Dokdonella sp.]|uniref:hypothetical protein n=1 Tax=Dokdonella sp. TaxID=2291710 RepID=UPI003F80E5E1
MTSFADRLIARMTRRPPDFVIGGEERPYLRRWWVLPRNPLFNVYLHEFLRSDDDRALHDHPWANVSVLLRGEYVEHLPEGARPRHAGDVVVRLLGSMRHRIELVRDGAGAERACWTLFITGPRYRPWFFYCPQGRVHWKDFTAPRDRGAIGRGCDQ